MQCSAQDIHTAPLSGDTHITLACMQQAPRSKQAYHQEMSTLKIEGGAGWADVSIAQCTRHVSSNIPLLISPGTKVSNAKSRSPHISILQWYIPTGQAN